MGYSVRNDARGIAQVTRIGWFKAGHIKSLDSQRARTLVTARKFVVRAVASSEQAIRGLLRPFGLKWRSRRRAGGGGARAGRQDAGHAGQQLPQPARQRQHLSGRRAVHQLGPHGEEDHGLGHVEAPCVVADESAVASRGLSLFRKP